MSWFDTLAGLISGIFKPAVDLVDEIHTSDEERLTLRLKMMEVQQEIITKITEFMGKELDAQKEVLLTELQGSWLQKNWRPLLMLGISTAVLNNLILVPYLNAAFDWSVSTPVSPELWNLLTIGVGGYVGGRSVEKVVETIKGKK